MGTQIIYNGKKPSQMLADFKKLQANIMILVGNEAVNFVMDNFKKQGFDTGMGIIKWPPRNPEAKRNDRPLLVDKGHLHNGIRRTVRGNITYISVAPPADQYAAVHNDGFNGEVSVKSSKGKTFTRHMNIPQRQYIGDSQALNKRIYRVVDTGMQKVFH
jgi:phage gpG-like protein